MWLIKTKDNKVIISIFDGVIPIVEIIHLTTPPFNIQFNSVYLPIKGPQGATGKIYIDE